MLCGCDGSSWSEGVRVIMASDLHMHTTASDGRLSPEELLLAAKRAGLRYIAITDHDSVGALRRLYELHLLPDENIRVILGIEFSAHMPDHEAHILGYHIDVENPDLQMKLEEVVQCRWRRFSKIVEKLRAMGYPISESDVLAIAGNAESIGRAHIAQALVNKGCFARLGDVFSEVLRKNGPAYVPHYRLSPREIIRLIKEAGGVSVVAHPGLIGDDRVVESLLDEGIDGIEAFHPKHSAEACEKYKRMAQDRGLLITGGSDFHGIPTRYPYKIGQFTIDDAYAAILDAKRAGKE